jgi:N,N'-diacetyllegionaminate synthase
MANSHEGDFVIAKKIIEKASNCKADGIKFQRFTADELALPNHENYQLYQSLEMSDNAWKKLVIFAKSKKLQVFFDVFGLKTAKVVSKLNIDGIKIHSADLSNPVLLKFLSTFKKTILLSTAGSYPYEIHEALEYLQKTPKEIILMHGFQGYPTSINEMNLSRISELKQKFNLPVGIMDHLSGDSEFALIVPLLAISKGANVIEKHITLDRSKKGLDYYSSLNPNEFRTLVSYIRKTESSFGKSNFSLSTNEKKYRLDHKKNTISKKLIKKNSKLTENLFDFKRTKTKKNSVHFFEYEKEFASKDIKKQTILTSDMITHNNKKVVAVIACRVESSRLFAKPFHLIDKEKFSILDLLIEQINKSKIISDVVLAISENPGNESFIRYAQKNHLKFVFGSDKDVLKRLIIGAQYVNANIIFRTTPENPFIYWEKIDDVLNKHIDGNFDFSVIEDIPLGCGYEVINLDALEKSHKFGKDKHRSELCSLYIHEHQKSFKINRFMPEKSLQRPEIRLTVDNPEDLMVVRKIYEKLGQGKKPVYLKKIIDFLDMNKEISKINSHILPGKSRIWD